MDFSFLSEFWSYFNDGLMVTLLVSVCVVFFGSLIGVAVALIKDSHVPVLEQVVDAYVWLFRGTPMVVQIMIGFAWMNFGHLPSFPMGSLTIDLTRLIPGIIIISLNSGAYISESVRAGLAAVPKGQLEAAYSLGLSHSKAMRHIIIPQAIRYILPSLGNEFITIIKDSALLQTIGITELWGGAQSVASATYLPIEPLLLAAAYYLLVTSLLSLGLKQWEKRLNRS